MNADDSLGKWDSVWKKLQSFAVFKNNRKTMLIENIRTAGLLYNKQNAMVPDGINLYMLQSE